MGEHSHIQWCDDTWNPWRGCQKVSAGCKNCYAEKLVEGRLGGEFTTRVRHGEATRNAPLRWNKRPWVCDHCSTPRRIHLIEDNTLFAACGCGEGDAPESTAWRAAHRRRVFSLSLGDWLDPEIPVEWLADMLDVIRRCEQTDFLLLTKRPELWREQLTDAMNWLGAGETAAWISWWLDTSGKAVAPDNIWLGVSVEDQANADKRIPELLRIPAAVRFVSYEPALGPVDFRLDDRGRDALATRPGIDWVIVGGESGPNARPFNVEWARSTIEPCQASGVACFVKQLGSKPFQSPACDEDTIKLKDRKGGDMSEWPEDLRVRQFPRHEGREADAKNTKVTPL